MDWTRLKVGFAVTGSFCTFSRVMPQLEAICEKGADVYPVMSPIAAFTDTRFGKAADFCDRIEAACGREIVVTVDGAEPFGPKNPMDIFIVAPCTGNTAAKLANGITDTSVTMAVKATLRNKNKVLLAVATNDALGASGKNIAALLAMENIYFVPIEQDDPFKKENSVIARMELIIPAAEAALDGRQMQPVIIEKKR